MQEREFDRWGKTREKGIRKYVLVDGALAWGIGMFVLMKFFLPHQRISDLEAAIMWPAAGAAAYLVRWFFEEHRYRKEGARRAALPPPVSENQIWKDY